MNSIERPAATYSATLDCMLEGLTVPLEIHADSINEIRKAIRLLHANNFLVPHCPKHHRAMKQNSRGWYCSAKDAEGNYCTERA